jgi:hypothetical protein
MLPATENVPHAFQRLHTLQARATKAENRANELYSPTSNKTELTKCARWYELYEKIADQCYGILRTFTGKQQVGYQRYVKTKLRVMAPKRINTEPQASLFE